MTFDEYAEENGIPEEQREAAYRSWSAKRVDWIVEALNRRDVGDGIVRWRRITRSLLNALATTVDPNGNPLPLCLVSALLDVGHPHHESVYRLVEPNLPTELRSTFHALRRDKETP